MPEGLGDADLDVAIIGGGPGGLATAAAIFSALGQLTRVKVYESLKEYTLQGSAVGLAANAQYALGAIHPNLLTRFEQHGLQLKPMHRYDLKGNLLEDSDSRWQLTRQLSEKYGKRTFLLGWHEIRQLLFEYLPPNTVEFDKQVTSYEEDAGGVTVHFDRGQPSVRAKVLIGADGYFSRIRKHCLNDGPPMFAGCVMWRARIAAPEGKTDDIVAAWSDPTQPVMTGPFAMMLPMGTLEGTSHKPWTWILGAPLVTLKEAGVEFDPNVRGLKAIQGDADSGSALENALKILEHMPKSLMDVVKRTDPSTVTQHGLYMRPLTDPSLHPLVAKAPPAEAPGTPPQEEEQKFGAQAAFGSDHQSEDKEKTEHAAGSDKAETLVNSRQAAAPQTADRASADETPLSPEAAPAATAKSLSTKGQSPKTDVHSTFDSSSSPAGSKCSSTVPLQTPPTPASSSLTGTSMGISPTPLAAPPISEDNGSTSTGADRPAKGRTAASASKTMPEKHLGPGKEAETPKPVQSDTWGKGKVTLLGDAAHATIPNGQGLALALEDAVVLAWHLRRQGLSEQALRSYELERPVRVKTIHVKGVDNATIEDRERYLYKPTFKPLWCEQGDTERAQEATCISNFEP